ncbi:MAG: NUDIX domain-containing protein [Chloroflexi bacterium]|nr:NUDIX domain-containing protein [Chloroflexota bacterium]
MDNVISLAEGFRAQLIHADAQAIMAMSRAWTGVEAALQTAVGDLAQQIADLKAKGEEVPQWKLWQMSQYQSLLAQIAGEMNKYSQGAIADIQDQQIKAQQMGAKHAKELLTAALAGQRSLGTAFDKLPTGAVENITALAQAGQPLNKLLENAYPTAVAGLTKELLYGTAVGRNPRETARIAVRKGLAGGLNHILLVARDQQIRNYREMVRQKYKDSSVVYGYMRLAARNTRTCMACIALDGTIYETGQVMALHPQDRCSMVPLVEGFPLPNIKPASEWFKSLDEDEQRRMMGDGRYEAWRDGLFEFRQLASVSNHPVWGPSSHVTSLTDLLGGKGGLGGAPIDPAALLKSHQAAKPAKSRKPQTLEIDKGDKPMLEQLIEDLAQSPIDAGTYKAIEGVLSKVLAGQQGLAYTDANGRLEGALAYQVGVGNLNYLHVTAAGFANVDANKKAILDAAAIAQQKGQGLELYVPNSHLALYQGWGFTVHQPLKGGARVRLSADDVSGFIKDPDGYGQVKAAKLAAAAKDALADPNKAFTFRSGQEIAGLPFKPVHMTDADFLNQTKALPHDPPLQIDDPDKHAAAGLLLFTPDGKLVIVDPAGQYGGYKTTFPKGTQEEGMSLQATAVKEVWEETGFKARILGHLGDYEKSTSVTRFYIGVVEDGAPWAAHYESEAVRIVPLDQVDALLNVGADKGIFQDLLKLKDQALEGKPFTPEALEAGLDKYASAAGKLPPPPGDALPADMTKKALVDHLAKMRGIAKWKLTVASKEQVAALFDLPEAEALAAIDAYGAAHTAKYSQKGASVAVEPPAVTKLPPPPEDPATLSKKALVEHLAQIRGIAKWKLTVATKDQVAALFDMPEAEAMAAIDAFGAAHAAKYAKTGASTPKEPPATPAVPPGVAAFQKYQADASSLTAAEAQRALEYAQAEGYSKVVIGQLKEQYQKQIGDPLITGLKVVTKSYLVEQLEQMTGLSAALLNQLKKGELAALAGQPMSAAYAAVGKPYTPTAPVADLVTPVKAGEAAAASTVTPLPPKGAADTVTMHVAKHLASLSGGKYQPIDILKAINKTGYTPESVAARLLGEPLSAIDDLVKGKAEPPQPEPLSLQTMSEGAALDFFADLNKAFQPGSPASKGTTKAQQNIATSSHSGFAYQGANGWATGVITFHDMEGKIKISGAAFTSLDVNKEAVADVANFALGQGKAVKTYVPTALVGEYKKWGFAYAGDAGANGQYMEIAPGSIPALVTAVGKKPKPAPKPAEKQAQAEATAVATTLGFPAGVGKHTALKLQKPALVGHLAQAAGISESKLTKYTKEMLVQFMEMPKDQATALLLKGAAPPPPAPPPTPPKAVPMVEKRPLPTNLPPFQMPDPPGFPAGVGSLKTVSSLGGSTGAKLVEDPATGKRYVMKKGNSAGHLREEAYADMAYQALGLNVPTFKVYDTPDGPVKLAEFKSGMKPLGEAMNDATPAERKAIVAEVRKGFAADALMGNWDVLGASKDNILVGDDGKVWRVDNGGGFRYRAQGKKKEKEFISDYPVELWTMRDKSVGPENAQLFGDLDIYEIMDQARGVVDKGEALLAAVPDELRPLVHGRLEVMRDLVGTSDTFKGDQWQAGYTDGFLEQSTHIRRQGLIDALPQQMKQGKAGSTTVYDEHGREFDVMRGKGSHVEAWAVYCKANGGDPAIISHWMGKQAGSSWSSASQALKYKIALERGGDFNDYFWLEGLAHAENEYKAAIKTVGEENYKKTWAMWHAWVYESLRHMEFARKQGGVVELVRTEGEKTMKQYGVKMGTQDALMLRGAAESGSIYRAKRIVAGGEVTRQRVPLHRILGYYWSDRPGAKNGYGGFLGNEENEFVFIPEGIPFDYVDSIHGSKGVEAYWQ